MDVAESVGPAEQTPIESAVVQTTLGPVTVQWRGDKVAAATALCRSAARNLSHGSVARRSNRRKSQVPAGRKLAGRGAAEGGAA